MTRASGSNRPTSSQTQTQDQADERPPLDAGSLPGPGAGGAAGTTWTQAALGRVPDAILVHVVGFVGVRDGMSLMATCRRALELVGNLLVRRMDAQQPDRPRRRAALEAEFPEVIRSSPGASREEVAHGMARARQIRAEIHDIDQVRNERRDVLRMLRAGKARVLPRAASDDES